MLLTADRTSLALKAKLFRGFGDPSRLSILEALRNGPLTVGEIVAATGLSQYNASNHLSCRRDFGLVVAEQEGRISLCPSRCWATKSANLWSLVVGCACFGVDRKKGVSRL